MIWLSAIAGYSSAGKVYYHGVGCPYCHNTGFKSQIGVFEFLEITPYLSEMLRLKDTAEFSHAAKESTYFRPLVLNGLDLVDQATTTISEVIRIMGEGMIDTMPPVEKKGDC